LKAKDEEIAYGESLVLNSGLERVSLRSMGSVIVGMYPVSQVHRFNDCVSVSADFLSDAWRTAQGPLNGNSRAEEEQVKS
jgi:hypothetical protein